MRLPIAAATLVLAVAPALASGGGEEGGGGLSLITPQPGLMIWTTLTFFVVLFVLSRVAWKPLLAAVAERERVIEGNLERARQEHEQAQRLLEEHKALVAQAHRDRAEAVEGAQRDAERAKAEILEEARKQREKMVEQAKAEVDATVQQARSDLRATAVDLAIGAAGKLLSQNLDSSTQRKLVEDYLADLERRPAGSAGLPT